MARFEEAGLDDLMNDFAEIADTIPHVCENCGTEFDLSLSAGSAECPSCGAKVEIVR